MLPLALLALLVAPPPDDCGLIPPDRDTAGPVPNKPRAYLGSHTDRAPVTRVRTGPVGPHPGGALAGKTVYLSPGHGFTWTDLGWRTQRGTHNDIVEDLVSAEACDQFVIPYLQAMGAYVVPVREPDLNTAMVIVDDVDATLAGTFTDAGTSEPGWAAPPLPLTDNTSPFAVGLARDFVAAASDTGRLVYATPAPRSGHHNVYVSYAQGPDRVADAHYIVRHDGGATHFRVDQRRHGTTWVLLGKFWFEAGADVEHASVVLAADSATPGAIVSADAVRLGGGMGMIDRGGGPSGRPMYEQSARYYTQWNGAPAAVFDALGSDGDDDVVSRSRFTDWEHEDGEDAVYVAWHSNAPNPQRGTSSYTYGPSAPPGSLDEFTGTAGSRELQDAVHAEIVGDLRAAWDPAWIDEGRFTAYFGEVNPKHNDEVPAVLVEVAYHDTLADADALRDPQWRRLTARAIAQGIARYFAIKDGTELVLPPEPPTAIAVHNDGAGDLRVSWRAPTQDPAAGDPPTHHRVHVSTTGRGFDDGTDVFSDSFTIAGLAPFDVRYVRITAVNAGGASLPSEILGARVAPSGAAAVALVGGYDRLDSGLLLIEDLSAHALGLVQRMWISRMNDGTYAVQHGDAIADAGLSFDSATDDAVALGLLDLTAYKAVDWFAGQDSSGDPPFTTTTRAQLAAFLDGGGKLLVSGSELAWAMGELGTPDEQAFLQDRLHATYSLDDADTHSVTSLADPFTGLAPLSFDDPDSYAVASPDVLAPNASTAALAYSGDPGGAAAVAWTGGVYLGFPFETILGADTRADVMARVFAHFELDEPSPGDSASDDEGSDSGHGSTDEMTTDTPSETSAPTEADDTTNSSDTTASESTDSDGCGCTAAPATSPWLLGLLPLFPRRRRRHA